jgi:membrane bound O-acyltransferase family protein
VFTEITDIKNVSGCGLFDWARALGPVNAALLWGSCLPAWAWMWLIALGLFLAAKWITIAEAFGIRWQSEAATPLWPAWGSRQEPKRRGAWLPAALQSARLVGYCVLWPGMDAAGFCGRKSAASPPAREWVMAIMKTALGAALVWAGAGSIGPTHPLLTGWIGMIGLVLLLHFGVFHLLSLFWRSAGIDAPPIMQSPAAATSLTKFWGGRWNRAFHDLMNRHVFTPLSRPLGTRGAMLAVFLVSGLLHELVISVPARGGYGLPTLYFGLQAIGVLIERSRAGRDVGLGSGWRGWSFVFLFAATPAFLLFNPVFIHHVILPMLQAIGAT